MVKVIIPENQIVTGSLSSLRASDGAYKKLTFVRRLQEENTVLCFNALTRELISFPMDEEHKPETGDYLRRNHFLIPENCDEVKLVKQVRDIVSLREQRAFEPHYFTILTTTDCNARCYYCFEAGCKRETMSLDTAITVAEYIEKCSKDEKAILNWFGGEPLCNSKVIDLICEKLEADGQRFTSTMVSNGYLFDEETVRKAVEKWKLKNVQITLDGTEEVYNRTKAFIYKNVNAFRRVFRNIGLLTENGIKVSVRLNIGLQNREDLYTLVGQIREAYGDNKNIKLYSHELFSDSSEEKKYALGAFGAKVEMDKKLFELGLRKPAGLSRDLKTNYCGADSGKSVVIMPDGDLTLCEHFEGAGILGNVKDGVTDPGLIDWWREQKEETPLCHSCTLYPGCTRIEHCPNTGRCTPEMRDFYIDNLDRSIRYEYQLRKESKAGEEEISEAEC